MKALMGLSNDSEPSTLPGVTWQSQYESNRQTLMKSRMQTLTSVIAFVSVIGLFVVSLIDSNLPSQAPVLLSLGAMVALSLLGLWQSSREGSSNFYPIAVGLALATTVHVQAILVTHYGHEPPKLLLTLIAPVLAMTLPLAPREYLPIALLVPGVHFACSPYTSTPFLPIELFMIASSVVFGWVNVNIFTQDREQMAKKEVTIQKEQAELKDINNTLEQRVTERTRYAEERTIELQQLALEVNRAEQRERQAISRTLHDDLQQILAAARLRLGTITSQGGEDMCPIAQDCLQSAQGLILEALETSRTLSVELAPYPLLDEGLPVALRWLTQRFEERYSLSLETFLDPDAISEDYEITTFLFHGARELLFNVVKHSNTQRATITLKCVGQDMISVSVANDYPTREKLKASEFSTTFGLPTIRRRAELMGGSIEINDHQQEQFTVTLTLPMVLNATGKSAEKVQSTEKLLWQI